MNEVALVIMKLVMNIDGLPRVTYAISPKDSNPVYSLDFSNRYTVKFKAAIIIKCIIVPTRYPAWAKT